MKFLSHLFSHAFSYGFSYAFSHAFIVVICAALASQVLAGVSDSSQQINNFDLPEQALQASLIEFALQANITIIADNDFIKGYRASAIAGPRANGTALTALLANSPLSYQYQPSTGSYIIRKKNADETPIIEEHLPVISATQTPQESPQEEVLVTGVRYPFRYHTVTNTQVDGGINYFDSSRFLNVLPQNLVQDQQPADLADLLKYASGITPGDGVSDSNDDVFIRGFQRHAIYVDGFRLSDSTGVKMLPANTERIEILKGPSTLLYGQAEPGGIINVVRKKPQDSTFIHMDVGAGSLGRHYASMDINSPVSAVENVNVRVVLAAEDQDESGENKNLHKELIAPSVTWQINDTTTLGAGYEFRFATQELNRNFAVLLPYGENFFGATLAEIAPQARPEFSTEFNLYNLELNHYFTPEWRLRANYFWQQESRLGIRTTNETLLQTDILLNRNELGDDFYALSMAGQMVLPAIIQPQTPEWLYSIGKIRSLYDAEAEETANNIHLNLDGNFATGQLQHRLIVGGDWHRQDVYKKYIVDVRDLFPSRIWPESEFAQDFSNILNTVVNSTKILGVQDAQEVRLLYDDYGIFIQDSIALNNRWVASAGTRYTITQGEHTHITDYEFTPLQTYKKFSSQLGLVFKPTENNSLFANYSQALRANYHIDDIGSKIAEPEISSQIELGVKSHVWNGRLLSSLAVFDIHKKNIEDLTIIEGYRTLLVGHEQNIRGLDADFTLQTSSDINIMGAVSLLNPKITSGENKGETPALVADKTASLFAHYNVSNHVELSGGIKYVSARHGEVTGLPTLLPSNLQSEGDAYNLDAYSTLDLGLVYHFSLLSTQSRLQLTVKNVLNEKYYTARVISVRENMAEGRAILGSLKVEF